MTWRARATICESDTVVLRPTATQQGNVRLTPFPSRVFGYPPQPFEQTCALTCQCQLGHFVRVHLRVCARAREQPEASWVAADEVDSTDCVAHGPLAT